MSQIVENRILRFLPFPIWEALSVTFVIDLTVAAAANVSVSKRIGTGAKVAELSVPIPVSIPS